MVASPSASTRRLRRWLKVSLGSILFAIAAIVAGRWGLSQYRLHAANVDLRNAIAEMDAAQPDGWRFSDLERRRKAMPETDNGADLVVEAARLLPKELNSAWQIPDLEAVPPPCKLPVELSGTLVSMRRDFEPALKVSRSQSKFATGRFAPLQLSDDGFSLVNPHVSAIRVLANALALDALVLAEQGQRHEACDSILAAFAIGRTIGDEPALMSQIARLVARDAAIETLQRLLALGVIDDSDLARLQEAIDSERHAKLLPIAIRGEIAAQHDFYGRIERGESDPTTQKLFAEVDFANKRLIVAQSHAYALRMLRKALDCVERPSHVNCMEHWENRLLHEKATDLAPPLAAVMTPGLGKVWRAERKSAAQLECARFALAVERFRLRHGRWPADGQAVVNANLLQEIPLDPADGQPLRFRQAPDGIVVHSIGPYPTAYEGDFWDDLSLPWYTRAEQRRTDRTEFRLWNVEERKRKDSPRSFDDAK